MTVPKPTPEKPWPVRVVSQKIAEWISRLGEVWVEGQLAEISDRPGAGTIFCVLRDPHADISLTITARRPVFADIDPPLTEGSRVIVRAKPDFYAGRGTLSLRASEFRTVGIGQLLARLEQLKKLLAAEGLFAPERKRPLPFLPRTIGLITGRGSAAERDVRRNAERRWPAVQFDVRNVAVQGPTAAAEIVPALKALDADPNVDVIVLARGGGSVEDLLPFSDEALCRAVFAATTPVVSAVGHEPDSPLLDFVADVRASTPTDAAKRIVPDFAEEVQSLRDIHHRLCRTVHAKLDTEQHWLAAIQTRPALANPILLLDRHATELSNLRDRATRCFQHRLDAAETDLAHTVARITTLSPQKTLDRGYAIVQHNSDILRAARDAHPGDSLRIRLADGELPATVTEHPPSG